MDPYNTADAQWGNVVPVNAGAAPAAPANPYAAPSARIAESRDETELVKSSRLSRLGAVLLDTAIFVVPAVVIAVALPAMGQAPGGLGTGATALMAVAGLAMVAFVIYQLIMLHRYGQTLGKKLVGIRIVRQDGSRAGLGRLLLLRYFVPGAIGAIPLVGALFSLVDALFIFGAEKRCIHDMMADTIVVDV